MKPKKEEPRASAPLNTESSKLVSLLALAAGAVGIPQTGSADVIFTNATGAVGGGFATSFLTDALPGLARLGFCYYRFGRDTMTSSRSVRAKGRLYVQVKPSSCFVVHFVSGTT